MGWWWMAGHGDKHGQGCWRSAVVDSLMQERVDMMRHDAVYEWVGLHYAAAVMGGIAVSADVNGADAGSYIAVTVHSAAVIRHE